ncbi:MAG: nuclear transport factor 2 family protein [Pseudomonadota bacterium]|nr:nuclear transport factor 2 family protein [Pseudomonadota bacterium]
MRHTIRKLAYIALGGAASFAHAQSPADLQALESELNTLGARIERLEDMTEVEIVQNAYGYYVDKAQWRSVANLFGPESTLEIGGKGVFIGTDRVFEYMTVGLGPIGPRENSLIDHQQFQCLPTVHEDGVSAEQRCIAFVMSSGGWGHVYYENDYEKVDGVWRFKALHGPFNMYSGYQKGWLDDVIINTFPEKWPPYPDLPPTVMYLAYPSYYAEPFHYPNPVTGQPMPPPDPKAGGMAFGR